MRWIIGDVHGMLRPLRALVDAVAARDPAARFLFAGDYVNRGPESRGVIDLLLSLPPGRASFVRGNHDDIFDLVLHDTCYGPAPGAEARLTAFQWFMNHGLANTFSSYDVDWAELESVERRPTAERLDQLAKAVPEAHRLFIRSLPLVLQEPDLFVAHAMWDPHDADAASDMEARLATAAPYRHRLLWGRYTDGQIEGKKRWKRTGYFGHTPVESYSGLGNVPLRGPRIVLVDTAAALRPHGRLTAACAESEEILQADRSGAIVEGG